MSGTRQAAIRQPGPAARRLQMLRWSGLPVLLTAALVWSYWRMLVSLFEDWQEDANYSVGQLVPLAALYLLWNHRSRLARCKSSPCWWGLAVILLAQAVRAFGVMALYESVERYSLVLTVLGLVLWIAGWEVLRATIWILLFLFLMVPLPGFLHDRISGPLQGLATSLAVYTLELMGVTVMREGHRLILNDNIPVAVAEACSGLRMLTAFVVVSWVMAFVARRPAWQKATLVISSVPVAILCNLIRLVITSLLFMITSSEIAERFFHDFAGLTMMPMAIAILLGELWLLARLVTDEQHA